MGNYGKDFYDNVVEIVNNNAKIRAKECMRVLWVKETSTVYSIISQGCTKTLSGTSSP
jgi:hypothetical protein